MFRYTRYQSSSDNDNGINNQNYDFDKNEKRKNQFQTWFYWDKHVYASDDYDVFFLVVFASKIWVKQNYINKLFVVSFFSILNSHTYADMVDIF